MLQVHNFLQREPRKITGYVIHLLNSLQLCMAFIAKMFCLVPRAFVVYMPIALHIPVYTYLEQGQCQWGAEVAQDNKGNGLCHIRTKLIKRGTLTNLYRWSKTRAELVIQYNHTYVVQII